jgi:tetratricopeptide (TPR) repeat protein
MVFYWAARAAWSLGRRAQARRRMHQAATLAPRSSTIAMGQTLMLLAAGQRALAAKALVTAAALEPNLLDPILYPTPLEGAIGLLGKVLDHPARLQIIRTQGYFYWRAKRVTAALRSFSAITQQRPRDGDALQMIARCQMALGQDTLALATAQRAVQAAPDHPHTYATRGEILLDQGQAEGAIADLRRAADHLPRDSRILTRLADACGEAEKPECAKRYYAYAVERDKHNAAAHFGMAMAYQQDQKWELAEGALQRAISLEPGQAKYHQAAAHLARLRGKVKAANRHRARGR